MARKSPINKRLKEARLAVGISQKQLGIAAGIDEFVASAMMNQYETGKHIPDFDVVTKIAETLNLPSSYFYTTVDDLAEIIKIYGQVTKKDQRKLLGLARQLLKA